MATIQKEGLIIGKDQDGNIVLIYPISTINSVDGLPEVLAGKAEKTTFATTTMTASGWNKTAKTYSFESIYPSGQYHISIEPNYTATSAQLQAYAAAMLTGRIDANVITAAGDMPMIDIPIIVKAVKI